MSDPQKLKRLQPANGSSTAPGLMRARKNASRSLYVRLFLQSVMPYAALGIIFLLGVVAFLTRSLHSQEEVTPRGGSSAHEIGALRKHLPEAFRTSRRKQKEEVAGGSGAGNPCVSLNGSVTAGAVGAYGSVPARQSTKDVLRAYKANPDALEMKEATRNGQFRAHVPVFSFVQFSAYRLSALKFGAVGFAARGLKGVRRLQGCLWKEKGGRHRVTGTLTAYYPGEHHELAYEAMVLVCLLEESTEGDRGGVLLLSIDNHDIIAYMEEPKQFPIANPTPPFKHRLAFCSPPLVGRLHARSLYEWLSYHRHASVGVELFLLYDAGAVASDAAVMAMLEPWVDAGVVQVVDVRGVETWGAWDHGHLLTLNDCAPRLRYTTLWGVSFDVTEFFSATDPNASLASLLAQPQFASKPFVSLGSRWWSIDKCLDESEVIRGLADRTAATGALAGGKEGEGESDGSRGGGKEKGERRQLRGGEGDAGSQALGEAIADISKFGGIWEIERMQFRWPHFYCTNEQSYPDPTRCLDYHGFRRYAFDPRRAIALQIHRTEVPRTGGADISADVARLNRFPDLNNATSSTLACSKRVERGSNVEWWVRDEEMALAVERVRKGVRLPFKQVEEEV